MKVFYVSRSHRWLSLSENQSGGHKKVQKEVKVKDKKSISKTQEHNLKLQPYKCQFLWKKSDLFRI